MRDLPLTTFETEKALVTTSVSNSAFRARGTSFAPSSGAQVRIQSFTIFLTDSGEAADRGDALGDEIVIASLAGDEDADDDAEEIAEIEAGVATGGGGGGGKVGSGGGGGKVLGGGGRPPGGNGGGGGKEAMIPVLILLKFCTLFIQVHQ